MENIVGLDDAEHATVSGLLQRRASDPALRRAAEVVRRSFGEVARRQLVADGAVLIALAEALAAVESALEQRE